MGLNELLAGLAEAKGIMPGTWAVMAVARKLGMSVGDLKDTSSPSIDVDSVDTGRGIKWYLTLHGDRRQYRMQLPVDVVLGFKSWAKNRGWKVNHHE
jgi:hypothetical protein